MVSGRMDGSAVSTSQQPAPTIDRSPPRAVFAELLARAIDELDLQPSPLAIAYVLELLEHNLRAPQRSRDDGSPTLAEAWLEAAREQGATQLWMLRGLGDRALFVSGFFGESLHRGLVGVGYYGQIGRAAYGQLSNRLPTAGRRSDCEPSWSGLYLELAEGFMAFVDLLAEVGLRSRRERSLDVLRVYDHYLETGSEHARRQLVRRGLVPPAHGSRQRWQ